MKDVAEALPGIEKIRIRFLSLLEERQSMIANHALAAWEATSSSETQKCLLIAQNTLHQIAGSAGSLGFGALGQAARDCENEIIVYLQGTGGNTLPVPMAIMNRMDAFISLSQSALRQSID